MTRKKLRSLTPGTAAYVVAHAKWRASRGRKPSMAFRDQRNPVKALSLAKALSWGYNVAFEYTAAAGAYEGVRTWTTYESREAFERSFVGAQRIKERVLEEGISSERCVEITSATPPHVRARAMMSEASRFLLPDGATPDDDRALAEAFVDVYAPDLAAA